MPDGLQGYIPTRQQAALHASRARYKVASGGVRSGKSMSAVADFVYRVIGDIAGGKRHPQSKPGPFNKRARARLNYWVVAPVYSLLAEAITYLHSFVPSELIETWNENTLTLYLRTPLGHVRIACKSADDPDRLVSEGIDGVVVDEAARVPGSAWAGAISSRLLEHRGWAIFATSPFQGRGNWVYSQLIANANPENGIDAFVFMTIDNPIVHPQEIEHKRRTLPPRYFKRDFLADWGAFGTHFYDGFDPKVHVVSTKRLGLEYGVGTNLSLIPCKDSIGGVDWGWTSPACLLTVIETAREFIVVDETYESGLQVSDPDSSKKTLVGEAWRMRRAWNVKRWKCDPSEPQNISQFTHSSLNAESANNSITHGVRKLASLLHVDPKTQRPRLRILDSCTNLIGELPRLAWKADADGNAIEGEPDTRSPDHAGDALRYIAADVTKWEDDGIRKQPAPWAIPGHGGGMSFRRY